MSNSDPQIVRLAQKLAMQVAAFYAVVLQDIPREVVKDMNATGRFDAVVEGALSVDARLRLRWVGHNGEVRDLGGDHVYPEEWRTPAPQVPN